MRRTALAMILLAVILVGCGGTGLHPSAGGSVHPVSWGRPAPLSAQRNPLLSVTPAVTMYDTITLATVPTNPLRVAGYTSGSWPTYGPLVQRYGAARVKSIAIGARYHAMCLDVEPGDATPDQVVAWIRADRAAGFGKPCVYSSYYEWRDQITPLLNAAHIRRSSFWAWDADYTYRAHIDYGFDGTQWSDRCLSRNLDCSLITKAFAGIAPPAPKPRPAAVHCFGRGPHAPACRQIRPLVARQSRARDATVRQLRTHHCNRPYRRPVCRSLNQRRNYFQQRIRAEIAATYR